MKHTIRKAAVLGAGVMGAGIAAHLANAGIPVMLLDIVPPKAAPGEDTSSKAFRNKFGAGALERFKKTKPAPLFTAAHQRLITIGNLEDDLALLADCDWIVEAVTERLDIKQALLAKVESVAKPTAIISSNTSGLSISGMLEGRSDAFKKRFCVTHFFNPVRYMKLLELVAGTETAPDVLPTMHAFGEEKLGKGIVYGKDTTNFIANRIGVYGMMQIMQEMQAADLTVEEVDKIFGPAMGRPSSAVFRTADIVGLDTFVHVSQNCFDTLLDDPERGIFEIPEFAKKMVASGQLGDKTGQGFYKKTRGADGKSAILAYDLATGEYREQKKVRFDSLGAVKPIEETGPRIKALLGMDDKAAKFAKRATLAVLAYSALRIPEIADDVVNIDRGMRWGFGWELGPFETWDALGVAETVAAMKEQGLTVAPWVDAMLAAGRTSFYAYDGATLTYWDISTGASKAVATNPRALTIAHLRRTTKKVKENFGASLWDMGDGIACVEFHTKQNSIDDDIVRMLDEGLSIAERDFRGLVIANDSDRFSIGANIFALFMAAQNQQWEGIRELVTSFQRVNQRLRYSPIPVVTAPTGLTLGGGAEVSMAGNAIQANSELYMGLVEVGVGLIPGGSGNLQLLRNVYGPVATDPDFDAMPYLKKVFLTIATAKVATSAEEARDFGFLTAADGVSMNRDLQIGDAKARAIGMAESGFRPPRPTSFLLPGANGRATIDMLLYDMEVNGQISAHDRLIANKLAYVLTGGDTSATSLVSEERLLELEAEAFLSLCGEEKSLARVQAMLATNKPLRN